MRRLAWGAGYIVAGAALTLLLTRIFGLWVINADQVNNLFIAQDWISGNWRLSGWAIAPDNYIGLEVPLTAFVWLATHDAVLTLRLMSALAWVILCAAAVFLALEGTRARVAALLALGALLIVPIHERNGADFIANSPLHVMTVACILAAIGLAARLAAGWPKRPWALLLFCLISLDAGASDPMFTVLGALPLAGALAVAELPPGVPRWQLVVLTLIMPFAGRMLIAVNMVTGGFISWPTILAFTPFTHIGQSFAITVKSALDVLGADPFGLGVTQAKNHLLRLPLVWLVGLVVWRAAQPIWARRRGIFSGTPALPLIETALILIIGFNIAVMLVTLNVIDFGAIRFILPAWASAAVLAARRFEPGSAMKAYLALVILLALGTDTALALKKSPPPFTPVDTALSACLLKTGLTDGFATYWRGGTVTLISGGRLHVHQLAAAADGTDVVPYEWQARMEWYKPWPPAAPFFVITEAGDMSLPAANVPAKFGSPTAMIPVGDAQIWIYGAHPDVSCAGP